MARASALLRLLFLGRRLSTQAHSVGAVLRWLCLAHALGKGNALTRGLSPSARGRGAMSQLRRPRLSQLLCGTREGGTALAASRKEAQHASLLHARAVPRWLWSAYALGKDTARQEASLLRRAAMVRRPSCGLQ